MYFLKAVFSCLVFLILIDGFTESPVSQSVCLQKIVSATRQLQLEVEKVFKNFNKSCNSTTTGDENEFEKLVTEFLKNNFTLNETNRHDLHQQVDHGSQKKESFLTKFKNKILSLIHGNKTEAKHETKLKRCLIDDLVISNLNDAKVTVEKETFNLTSSDVVDLQDFLLTFINCLTTETRGKEASENSPAAGEDT